MKTDRGASFNFDLLERVARSVSPANSAPHLVAKLFIQRGSKAEARMLGLGSVHDAFSATWCRNAFLSSPGRNLKNLRTDCKRTSVFPFSRFAPAKKSAQIISKQYLRNFSVPTITCAVSVTSSLPGTWHL